MICLKQAKLRWKLINGPKSELTTKATIINTKVDFCESKKVVATNKNLFCSK